MFFDMTERFFLITAFVWLLFIPDSFAQISTVHIKGYGSTDFSASFMKFSDWDSNEKAILGTPYINKDWMYGELVLDTDLSIETMFRYNLESQNIELIYDLDTLIFLQPLRMKEFHFMGKKFIYDIALGSDRRGDYMEAAYLEVLVDGNCQLLRKYEKFISTGSNGLKYAAAEASTETYQMRTNLYIRYSPLNAPVRLNKINKRIIDSFPGNNSDLVAYIRDNSLKLNSEDNLMRLIEYYNSLVVNN